MRLNLISHWDLVPSVTVVPGGVEPPSKDPESHRIATTPRN